MDQRSTAFVGRLVAGALLLGATASSAVAQDADSLRQSFLIDLPPTIAVLSTVGSVNPGSSAASPTAFGANFGDGFAGIGFQHRSRFGNNPDGSAVVGIGLGNSRDLIGIEAAFSSYSTVRSPFLSEVGLSLKAHRVLPRNIGIAVGWENALQKNIDSDPSLYAVASKVWGQQWWNPFTSVTASLGVGNGRFRSESDVTTDEKTVSVFGSVGMQVWEPVSFIGDWNGQDLTLATSFVPIRRIPLIVTAGFADITGSAGDGARFTLGAGMGFDFADLSRVFP